MNNRYPYYFIAIAAAVLFIPFLGNVHLFDWDEINFAESAREMMVTGEYGRVMINFQPFWEKPPLFFWMQVISMKLFGVTEFAARFPNAICGIITLMILYHCGKKLYNHSFGLWWALIYAGCFMPHFYFKSGIIDPWFNLFIFLGIYFLIRFLYVNQKQNGSSLWRPLIFSSVFTGLGILTKGPVALMVVLLTYLVFIVYNKRKAIVAFKYYLVWALAALMVSLLWFGYEIYQHGFWFVKEFYEYQIRLLATEESGHGGPVYYHFVVLLIGVFPASLLIFRYKKSLADSTWQQYMKQAMIASLLVIVVVFSLVQTKIVHYSSFAYYPITYLATVTVFSTLHRLKSIKRWQKYALLVFGLIWALIGMILPLAGMNTQTLTPLIDDEFAVANLEAAVSWTILDLIPGLGYALAIIMAFVLLKKSKYKKGFVLLFVSTLVYVQCIALFFVPRIEKYTQYAAIEFLKSLQGKDCYVETYGYKSYAQYYYSKRQPGYPAEAENVSWLMDEKHSKPIYIICRLYSLDELMQYHGKDLKELYRKNGYVFFEKKKD